MANCIWLEFQSLGHYNALTDPIDHPTIMESPKWNAGSLKNGSVITLIV
jgi:hypothetical protein